MSAVEKTAERILRDAAGVKPDYVATMMFISEYMTPRDTHRRKKRRQRRVKLKASLRA
jgi:hypothetical protein